jgi:hypothetical protein
MASWNVGAREKNEAPAPMVQGRSLAALEGISLAVLRRGLRMTREQVEGLLIGVGDDIKSNSIHVYIPV